MTGKELFEEYEKRMNQLDIGVEHWWEMSESEQGVWEQLAVILR